MNPVRKLKGDNQINKHQKIADGLVSQIAACDGVKGIVFIGGLARGFLDKYSDVDLTAFLDKKNEELGRELRKMAKAARARSGVDIDLEIYQLNESGKWGWDEPQKWDYSHARIAFDPEGQIAETLRSLLATSDDFWVKRIAACTEFLKWYCCPPKDDVVTIAEAWINRGDLTSAHYCLNHSVDLILELLFALNREFWPAPKWRIFYSYALSWLPVGYDCFLKEALVTKELSRRDLKRRLKSIRTMWIDVLPRVKEETGLSLDQLSKVFVEGVLGQQTG